MAEKGRGGYPSDVTDEEWAFVLPYLLLCREDSPQRKYDLRTVFDADLDRLTIYFQKAVTDELEKSGRYQFVTAPGPDVLELRVAITDVEPTGGGKNAAVTGAATVATVGWSWHSEKLPATAQPEG